MGQRVFHSRHIGAIALLGWLEAGEIGGRGCYQEASPYGNVDLYVFSAEHTLYPSSCPFEREKEEGEKYSRNVIFWEKNEHYIEKLSQKSQNNLGTCVQIPYRGFQDGTDPTPKRLSSYSSSLGLFSLLSLPIFAHSFWGPDLK